MLAGNQNRVQSTRMSNTTTSQIDQALANLVKKEFAKSKEQYAAAVMSCYNHFALGELYPTLTNAEQWIAKHHDLQIGGSATEAAFDAMRKFGMTVEQIQKAIK